MDYKKLVNRIKKNLDTFDKSPIRDVDRRIGIEMSKGIFRMEHIAPTLSSLVSDYDPEEWIKIFDTYPVEKEQEKYETMDKRCRK